MRKEQTSRLVRKYPVLTVRQQALLNVILLPANVSTRKISDIKEREGVGRGRVGEERKESGVKEKS